MQILLANCSAGSALTMQFENALFLLLSSISLTISLMLFRRTRSGSLTIGSPVHKYEHKQIKGNVLSALADTVQAYLVLIIVTFWFFAFQVG
jgi:hypothetical protein